MADDPTDEDFDEEELDVDLDVEDLGDELEGDLVDEIEGDEDLEDEEAAADAALAARPKREDDDDDDEDINPDDVEADLDEILKDRIAAADEEEDDEEEIAPEPRSSTDIAEGVTPKRANEFMCTGCFLLVNRGQFGPAGSLHCPVGEEECPAIALISSGALDKPVRKAAPKKSAAEVPVQKAPATRAPATRSSVKKAPAKKAAAKKAPAKKAAVKAPPSKKPKG